MNPILPHSTAKEVNFDRTIVNGRAQDGLGQWTYSWCQSDRRAKPSCSSPSREKLLSINESRCEETPDAKQSEKKKALCAGGSSQTTHMAKICFSFLYENQTYLRVLFHQGESETRGMLGCGNRHREEGRTGKEKK